MSIKNLILSLLIINAPFAVVADTLAYLKYTENYWQVFLYDLSTKNEQQLTHSQFDKAKLSLFDKQQKLLATGIQGELAYIDIAKKQESKTQQLSATENIMANDVAISENGRYLLYSAITKKSDLNKLFIRDNQTHKTRQIFNMEGVQFDPAWSAKNDSFYFIKGDKYSPYAIWKSSLDGLKQQAVIKQQHHVLDIATAKNDTLAYSSNQTGNYDIWLYKNKKSIQLTDNKYYDGKPALTQDAKTVYYESIQNGVPNIWAVKVNAPFQSTQVTYSKQGIRHPVVISAKVK